MALIFENIIKDLSQIGFFSKYKFRKRDASFLLKTKGGKYIIELDHWMDETTSSLVIYPIYGIRFDILHKWFEKFSIKSLQDQRDRASISFLGICFLYKINSILVWMEKNIQPTLIIFKPISKNAQSMFLKNFLLLMNYTRRRFYQF